MLVMITYIILLNLPQSLLMQLYTEGTISNGLLSTDYDSYTNYTVHSKI